VRLESLWHRALLPIVLIVAALIVGYAFSFFVGAALVVIALAIASFTYGGLLGAFFLALFWRRARQRDAMTGMAVSITIMAFIVFAGRIVQANPALRPALGPFVGIAWPWYVLIGTTITFVVGMLSSLLPGGTAQQVTPHERCDGAPVPVGAHARSLSCKAK
jgi:solute:Na+ symporter, SSS family